jgi:hypothetical protein
MLGPLEAIGGIFICPRIGHRCQCLYKPCGYPYFRSRQLFKGRALYQPQKLDYRSMFFEKSRQLATNVFKAAPRDSPMH